MIEGLITLIIVFVIGCRLLSKILTRNDDPTSRACDHNMRG